MTTPNLLPAETDLRGRCDMAFRMDERYLDFLSEGSVGAPVHCHDPVSGIYSIFARAELKKYDDSSSVEAARHQWAVAAYPELLSCVQISSITPTGLSRALYIISGIMDISSALRMSRFR